MTPVQRCHRKSKSPSSKIYCSFLHVFVNFLIILRTISKTFWNCKCELGFKSVKRTWRVPVFRAWLFMIIFRVCVPEYTLVPKNILFKSGGGTVALSRSHTVMYFFMRHRTHTLMFHLRWIISSPRPFRPRIINERCILKRFFRYFRWRRAQSTFLLLFKSIFPLL